MINRDGCDDHRNQETCDCAMADRLFAESMPKPTKKFPLRKKEKAMKHTIEIDTDELDELLEDLSPVSVAHWRHGTRDTYVFEKDGHHWRVEIRVHHSEGWQLGATETCTRVVPVEKTVTVWEEG